MGRISSSVGLITGTAIQDTVDQLISISARPRDRLTARNALLEQERAALTDLTVLAVGVQLSARGFGTTSAFNRTSVASADTTALSATRSGEPAVGKYSVRTLQTASTQAFSSRSFSSGTRPLGTAGSITVRGGGYVDRSVALDELNGGRGVEAGAIRITDRSGENAIIDLSAASTVEDVLSAINEATGINVRATTDGDRIRLVDLTGETSSNLIVEEVGGRSTAADLGFRGINVSASEANGADILRLSQETKLSQLRDGRGLGFASGDDLRITLSDGSEFSVDFGDFSREVANASGVTGNSDTNAGLTFSSLEEGAVGDGIRVRFIDDVNLAAGGETVTKIEGDTGVELVFRIREGVTTANDIVNALADNEELAAEFSVTAEGDGSGLISTKDVAVLSGGAAINAVEAPQLGDLLRVLNSQDPTKFRAELAPGADRIKVVDLTDGDGEFSIEDLGDGTVASDLGIAQRDSSDALVGAKLLSGLSTVSLSALNGGRGTGNLTSLTITTADGSQGNVDVSAASTLQDVINAINSSGLSIEAGVSGDGGGLQIRDLSGGSANLFRITSDDGTAGKLGIDIETTDVLISGDNLNLQFVSRGTLLSQWNQGQGVSLRSFRLTDSNGDSRVLNLAAEGITTVGGLIDEINELGIGITAAINESGDGIRLRDTVGGAGVMKVEDLLGGNTAAELGLAGSAKKEVVDGVLVNSINGRQADVFTFASSDTLADLAARIRDEGKYANASLSSNPSGGVALAINSRKGGSAGRLSISGQGLDLGLRQSAEGRDALITVSQGEGGAGARLRSSDGVFVNAIEGVTLTAKEATADPITVDIAIDQNSLEATFERFVTQYNNTVSRIDELTFYNADTATAGVLFGRSEVVRIESQMSNLISSRLPRAGSIRSAVDLGFRVGQDGKLAFDKTRFREVLQSDPAGVEEFVTRKETGFAARMDQLIDQFAGVNGGVFLSRTVGINDRIERNQSRIESLNIRLDNERNRLLKQFYSMESAISKVQNNQQYISSISYLSFPSGE